MRIAFSHSQSNEERVPLPCLAFFNAVLQDCYCVEDCLIIGGDGGDARGQKFLYAVVAPEVKFRGQPLRKDKCHVFVHPRSAIVAIYNSHQIRRVAFLPTANCCYHALCLFSAQPILTHFAERLSHFGCVNHYRLLALSKGDFVSVERVFENVAHNCMFFCL